MRGQLITDENCPTVAGSWALADETASKWATTNQRSATNRTFNRWQELDQGFSDSQKESDFRPTVGCITNCSPEMVQQSS